MRIESDNRAETDAAVPAGLTDPLLPGGAPLVVPRGAAPDPARVAVARRILTLVYYGLRDGEIRCLQADEA